VVRVLTVLVSASLVVSTLSGAPAQASDFYDPEFVPELRDVKMPKSTLNKNTSTGSVSEIGEALAEAAESDKPVVVDELTTATEQLVANPDGTVTSVTAQAPVRAKNGDGDFVPLDSTLTPEDGRLEPKVASKDVSFSGDGSGDLAHLQLTKDTSVALSLTGELGEPTTEGGVATYDIIDAASTLPDATETPAEAERTPGPEIEEPAAATSTGDPTVQTSVTSNGFSAHVVLAEEPSSAPEYVFDLDVQSLTPTLNDGVLQFRNAGGKLVAESAPLNMWDATVDEYGFPTRVRSVDSELIRTADGGWQLILKPSMDYLTDEDTTYPVVVDPVIGPIDRRGDTYVESDGGASTNFGTETHIKVGYDGGRQHEGFMSFAFNQYLGLTVTKAELTMWQFGGGSCQSKETYFRPVVANDGPNVTWNNRPQRSDDARWQSTMSGNRGESCTTPATQTGTVTADLTPMVNGWAGRHVGTHAADDPDDRTTYNDRQAFYLQAPNPTDATQYKRFCSLNWSASSPLCNSATKTPELRVTYTADLGQQSWYSMTERKLNDRMGLAVNNRNGNLLFRSNDVDVNSVGLDFTLDRTYNAQGTETGTLGTRWSLSMGPDIWLEKKSPYRYDFHAAGGTVLGSFVRKSSDSTKPAYKEFSAPLGGVGAELEQRSDDNGDFLELTYRKSRMRYTFAKFNSAGDAFMTGLEDRSGNATEIDYASGTPSGSNKPIISTFEDTSGRSYTPTYNNGRITQIETGDVVSVGVRTWTYTYNSDGDLTSSTDAEGVATTYTYTTDPVAGAKRLERISQPFSTEATSKPQETIIGYGIDGSDNTVPIVVNVGYRLLEDSQETPEQKAVLRYTWDYRADLAADCEGNGEKSTVVKDPMNRVATYCYEARDNAIADAKIWVYDGLGNEKSQDFNADNQPLASGGASGGSTVADYNKSIDDQLSSITEPKNAESGSGVGAETSMAYNTPSSVPGAAYLPSAVRSGDNSCNRYGYDDKGRTTTAFTGTISNAKDVSGCSASGGRKVERDYDDTTGVLLKSWDSNADAGAKADGDRAISDADRTIYTYWRPDQTGYVAGTNWQVKTVRKPGGSCVTGTTRKLCTSYTYDGAGRVVSMTDGEGNVTEYQYDKNDRVRSVNYPGWNSVLCPGGLDPNCIRYNYDLHGNLVQRIEDTKSTYFFYDRLGRQTQISTPVTAVTFDTVGMAYDGAGNLIGYQQNIDGADPDITFYAWDAANRPDYMFNALGTTDFANDEDGRMDEITFPALSGHPSTQVTYDYGRNGRPNEMKWKSRAGTTTNATWAYDYTRTINFPLGPVTFESPQMQKRTVTSSAGVTAGTREYAYDAQRLSAVDDSGGTDYEYTYDGVDNIRSEKAGSTTTHYGYNMAGERCWRGTTAGSDTQKISRSCATGPAGSTAYSHDNDGNNEGLSGATTSTTYNDRRQVSNIDGLAQDHLDQGNDLRTSTGSIRTINGPLGVTAFQQGNQTVFLSRAPSGQLLTFRPTTGTSLYYISEPNGNIAGATNIAGYLEATYQYAPYGKTSTGGLGHFNPFRYLGGWQETTASGDPGHYKFGARYYNTTGMFTQPDALTGNMGDPRTMTAYNYAGGDPINQADPSGYLTVSLDLGGCLGICVGYRWDYEVGSAGKDDLAVTPYAGVGSPSGPSISFASGGIRSGASRATSCNLGPAGLTSANGGTPQFTAFVGLKALGCSATASYTFGADQ
jgi:RHS repeat-associated protein